MRKTGGSFWLIIISIILAVTYSILLFSLKKDFNFSAWILYGFTMLSFLIVFLQLLMAFIGKPIISYSIVTILITLLYWAIQFVFAGIICMLFVITMSGVVMVSEVALLVVYLILLFSLNAANGHAKQQDIREQNIVKKMRLLENDVRSIADMQTNPETKKQLEALADEIHFSDVYENPQLEEIDSRISEGIIKLKYLLDKSNEPIDETIKIIKNDITERNRKAAALKQ